MNIDRSFAVHFVHRLRFTRGAFDPANPALRDVIREGDRLPGKAMVFVDQGLVDGMPGLPASIEAYFDSHARDLQLAAPIQFVPGGETCKNNPAALEGMCRRMNDAGLCRQSYVIAVGGGAVLDTVGFAAAIAHRGVRLIRLPSTTLAQCDSGVGVKGGVNAYGKKNFLGYFAPPFAVINDEALLATLSDDDWISGFSEAVKVACFRDRALFDQIEREADAIRLRNEARALPILRRSAELHLDHIVTGGDPFEMTTARPLDFGHWAAHKLEAMSNYALSHGHAVAIGIAVDVTYSMLTGRLSAPVAHRIIACLRDLGFDLHHPAMRHVDELLKGIEEFREHLGGQLTLAMLEGIGQAIDIHTVDMNLMRQAIERISEGETHAAMTG